MDCYKYKTLDTDALHIRLVKLHALPPGSKDGEITCSIGEYSLSEAPEYEALSYCWGDANNQITLACDGKTLKVPASLRPFLLRTRAKGRERILWIDSICINQVDDREKGSQVQEMHTIYRKASRTLIWLGPESASSLLGIQFALWLYKLSIDAPEVKRKWRYKFNKYWECSGIFLRQWKAFFELFDRAWFSRAWIVQEAVLSSNAWITCGDAAIPWGALVGALSYAFTDQAWIFEFYGTANMNILVSLFLSQHEVTRGMKRFHYEILVRHRQSIASKEQDTVFAFRGLSGLDSFDQDGIIPDYQIAPESLCTNLAVATLSQASNLDFLSIPRLCRREEGLALPSWVPDWSCRTPLCISLLQLEEGGASNRDRTPYNATRKSSCRPIIDKEPKCLLLSGFAVDKITSLSEVWDLQESKGFQTLRKQALVLQKNQVLVEDWRAVALNHGSLSEGDAYVTGETMFDAMWQTCVAGIYPNGDKQKMARTYARFYRRQRILRLIPKYGLEQYLWVWMVIVVVGHLLRLLGIANPETEFRTSVSVMVNRRLFRTERGFVGMGPAIAGLGDEVALFKGGRMPMVIKAKGIKVEGEGKEAITLWEFFGDAYVHGAMNGELWSEDESVIEQKCQPMCFI